MPKITAKRVSNYELFYDLVFVLATSNLTALLHIDHVGVQNIEIFIVANLAVLSIWLYETIYMNKYGERDRLDIYSIIASMFVIGQLSLGMTPQPGQQELFLFQFLFMLVYALILLQYYLRGRKIGYNPDLKHHIAVLAVIVAIFAVTSVLTFTRLMTINMWSLILPALPLVVPWFMRRDYDDSRINFPHIVERCQLLTILTFGESVIAILKTYLLGEHPVTSAFLFGGMAWLFILYISQTYLNIEHHQESRSAALLYAHMAIILGLNFFTVGLEMLPDHHHSAVGFCFFLAGLWLFYLGLISTSTYNRNLYRIGWRAWVCYGAVLLLGSFLLYLLQAYLVYFALTFAALTYSMGRLGFIFRRRARERDAAQS